jgi:hypothetical protein
MAPHYCFPALRTRVTPGAPAALGSEERCGTESGDSGLEAAVLATVVEERFAIAQIEGFHFTDEDGVVAGRVLRDHVAGEMSQGVFEEGNARVRPVKANAEAGIVGRILLRIGKEFGKMLLGISENTDAEATLRLEIRQQACILIHADKDQKRVEGDGSERVGGHAVDLAGSALGSNHSNARGEGSENAAKKLRSGRGSGHAEPH